MVVVDTVCLSAGRQDLTERPNAWHTRARGSLFVSLAHPRKGVSAIGKGAGRPIWPLFDRSWLTVHRLPPTVRSLFALPLMARHTQATLTARVAMAARALGLPLQQHGGPDGFNVGALRLVRQDGAWTLFQIVNNAGASDRLITGDAGDIVAFVDGMVAAANVQALARRFERATAPTLPEFRADAAADS